MASRSTRWTLALALVATPAAAQTQDKAATPPKPAADKPATPPAPSVTVGGVAYLQFAHLLKDTAHANGFDVARAYLTLTGKFAQGVGGRITADIYRVADGSLAYRLKYGFLTYTPAKSPASFRLGMTQTPWVEFEEQLWGYRMQGTIAVDRNGYLGSSDFGFATDLGWKDDGINIQAGVYNGEGYSKASGDKRKDAGARFSVRLAKTNEPGKFGGLRLNGYVHYGTPTGGGERKRALAMVSYRSKRATFAVEHGLAIDSTVGKARTNAAITTAFGVLRFPRSPIALVGRVDVIDPDKNATGDKRTRYIAGVSYKLSPNLLLLADLDHLSYQSGAPTPALEAARSSALFQVQLSF